MKKTIVSVIMGIASLTVFAAETPSAYVQTDGNSAFPTDLTLEFPAKIEMLHYADTYNGEASYALLGYNASS